MSYARFLEGDVYVFGTSDAKGNHFIECYGCHLPGGDGFFHADHAGMLAHLKEHVAAGHSVPERAFDRLEEELAASRADGDSDA